jgi:predicted nucleic acid-binding protein
MSSPLRIHAGEPLVIDSSVAFKWFDRTEPGAETARDLARQHAWDDIALVAPAHLPLEVVNVLVSRRAGVNAIERAIEDLASVDLAIAPVDDALLADAARIADAESIALYDAAFIALAARLDCELVTADRRQAATTSCRVRLIG